MHNDKIRILFTWAIVILEYCVILLSKNFLTPPMRKMVGVELCIIIAIVPCLAYVFVTKDRAGWFVHHMTKKSTHLILGIGWIVLMSQPMDILMGFGQFSILSQVGMYIIMLILFGISLALTQRGGMMGYFYSLTEKFEKDDDGSSEIILSTMRPQVEKTLENSKAGKIAALVILSLLVICPLAPADVSVRAIELISYLLACFLALIVYFWIDRYVRDNLYHYLVILKNAVQNDQRFLFKSLLAKRLRRNRFFITLMFGLCVLVSILLNYEAINKW